MNTQIEYKVREVPRYLVTRYETELPDQGNPACGSTGISSQHGEFDNADTGYAVAYALARAEHQRLGYPPGDMRIGYPEPLPGLGRLSESVTFGLGELQSGKAPYPEPAVEPQTLGQLPYETAASLRRHARQSGDLALLLLLDRDQVAVDA